MASQLTPLSTSPLLQLPGEIRNKIYEYALSSAEPLENLRLKNPLSRPILSIPKETVPSDDGKFRKAMEFNQLKFANKQLYAEIAGLELRYITIYFPYASSYGSTFATKYFLSFIDEMKPSKISWLTKVVVEEAIAHSLRPPHKAKPGLQAVISFAKQHSDIQIRYKMRSWCLKN